MTAGIYSKILSGVRSRDSEVKGRSTITESESDRGRVLFCAAFRRLQQKAQVFSMEPNAAVRSRLTHSLEVSQLGRFIADEVGVRLVEGGIMTLDEKVAMGNFVETACLLHDIGNPPFGHFGEAAIQKWFSDFGSECLVSAVPSDLTLCSFDAIADFREFDGNPQGLRVVSRLQWNNDGFGLNLTKTSLASFLKYIRVAGAVPEGLFSKKAGFFSTEESIVKSVWGEFGYASPQRFPLAYMMEAADDIAYCVSDLEDSIEKGLVHQPSALLEIRQSFMDISKGGVAHDEILGAIDLIIKGRREDGKEFTYTDFRTRLNRIIVGYVADRYRDFHDQVLSGCLEDILPATEAPGAILESLKAYCRNNVYRHESVQRIELAGYTAIKGLLDQFKPLLQASRDRFNCALGDKKKDANGLPIVIESKFLNIFPEKYIKVYRESVAGLGFEMEDNIREWNLRAHLVVDFISGMTDDFAMTTYRTLAGMRL